MRNSLIAAATLLAGLTIPAAAFADPSRNNCRNDNSDQVAGAVIGGLLGGVVGSQVAGHGNQGEGAAIGAVVGGLAGVAVTNGNNCGNAYRDARYNQRYGYNNNQYNRGYNGYNTGYAQNPHATGRYVRNPHYVSRSERRRAIRHDRRDRRYYNQPHRVRNGAGHGNSSVNIRVNRGH